MKSVWSRSVAVVMASLIVIACGDDTGGGASGGGGGAGGTTGSGGGDGSGGETTSSSAKTSGAGGAGGDGGDGGDGTTTGASTTTTGATSTSSASGGGSSTASTTAGTGGAGGGGQIELPDVSATVQQVASEHPDLLEINTFESCGLLVQHVLARLSADDPEWGHVAKTAGEGQYSPPDWVPVDIEGYTITGFSHDAIFHRAAYRQVDIIANAGANSDPDKSIHGPGSITWGVIEPEFYRDNNPWMAPVPPP